MSRTSVLALSALVSSLAVTACQVEPPVDRMGEEQPPPLDDVMVEPPGDDDDMNDGMNDDMSDDDMTDDDVMDDQTDDDVMDDQTDDDVVVDDATNDDEPQADGPRRFTVRLSNIAPWSFLKSGSFNTPVGKAAPGAIRSGDAYEVTFTAGDRHRLSFVTMLGASNDWFYGTPPEGIALYEEGVPLSRDVTSLLRLYDAGTEIDEEPAVGAHTGPKQSSPDEGPADAVGYVRALVNPIPLADGSSFSMPSLDEVLRVTITTVGARTFRLRIENVSAAGALSTSEGAKDIGLSPGVWVLHGAADPLFAVGEPDYGHGLELIAESGRIATLGDHLASESGVATGFSPAVYVVHDRGMPLFSVGQPDRGQGLEEIAEAGNVSLLDEELGVAFPEGVSKKGIVDMTEGSMDPGPVRPGQSYAFSLTASPGDRLSFASMFGASNDWIVATPEGGIALFDEDGAALSGDFTGDLGFYDVGTEIDEEPAVGAYVGPNQDAPDQGPADPNALVRELSTTTYAVPVEAHLMLTISVE